MVMVRNIGLYIRSMALSLDLGLIWGNLYWDLSLRIMSTYPMQNIMCMWTDTNTKMVEMF